MNESLPADISTLVETPTIGLRDLAVEVFLRIACASLFTAFAYAAFNHWLADPTRFTLLFIVIGEAVVVCLALLARIPYKRDWHPTSILCSLGATYYFLGINLAPGSQLIPEIIGVALQIISFIWQIYAKLSLRLSFGILPANRGIVTSGAYRFMRHPIYAAYFVAHVGFVLTNFGLQNLLVFAGLYCLQFARIIREERLLSQDPTYRAYRARVRYRFIPYIF